MLQILIVSLKQDVVKRKIITEKLNDLKVDFEFIDAVYGKDLSESFCQNLQLKGKLKYRGFKPTRGEIGCTLSHISAFSKILNINKEWVCILEDDVIVDERFRDFIYNFDSSTFDANNLFILGGQDGLSPSRYIAKSLFKKMKIGDQIFNKVNQSEKYVNRTCCYIVNKKSALKMVNLFKDGFYLADDWQSFKKEGVYQHIYLSNFVAHPLDLTLSSIEQEREEARNLNAFTSKGLIYNLIKKTYLIGQFFYTQLKRFY